MSDPTLGNNLNSPVMCEKENVADAHWRLKCVPLMQKLSEMAPVAPDPPFTPWLRRML
jgi:hypothetical protein